ncbi:MAG: hypothetical protein RR390_00675 [Hafnia sp.]
MNDWIDVNNRVPLIEDGEMMSEVVCVMSLDVNGDEYTYHSRYSRISGFNDYLATHWLPLTESSPE